MKTEPTPEGSPRRWGIYYFDREYARELGDPLRTVIQAQTKQEAEREAIRLGFDSPWAHPVTEAEARNAQWLPLQRVKFISARQTVPSNLKRYEQPI